jgi:hypothetical protein
LQKIDDVEASEREKLRVAIDNARRVRQRHARLYSQQGAFERLADEQLSFAADFDKHAKQRDEVRAAATRIIEVCKKSTPSDDAVMARAADINAMCETAPTFDEHARRSYVFAKRAASSRYKSIWTWTIFMIACRSWSPYRRAQKTRKP